MTTDDEAAAIAVEMKHVWWCLSEAGVNEIMPLVRKAARATGVTQIVNLHEPDGWVIHSEVSLPRMVLVKNPAPPVAEDTPHP